MYSVEEFDKQKTKVLKYILYKRRTEQEIKTKFISTIPEDILEDIIQYLKDAKYIDDKQYIEKAVNNFKLLKNLSIKELTYKLLSKGLSKSDIENYIYENKEELEEYEQNSIRNIMYKKQNSMDIEEIKQFLIKKGYQKDNIVNVIEEET